MRQFWLICLFIGLTVKPAYAVSVNILSSPTSVGEDKFSITVQVVGADPAINYLRASIYKDGTSNYFGETDNGQYWYDGEGSVGNQFFPVEIVKIDASPSPVIIPSPIPSPQNVFTMSARIGNPSTSDYPGPGQYKLKVRRYTAAGREASNDSATPVDITLTKTWPSLSPSPIPTSTATATPTQTPSPTPTPTPKPSVKPSPQPSTSPELNAPLDGTVAGEATEIDLSDFGVSPSLTPIPSTSPIKPVLNESRAKTTVVVGTSLLILSTVSFLAYRKYRALPKP